jgi:ubiquinone/menaquinone biosynthesis C-methylase UbiE
MSDFNNPEFLKTKQYRDGSNLNARIQLHERFGKRKQDWQRWVFEQIETGSESKLLELGCGPGWLWVKNLERIPKSWEITLSDLSEGMVSEAKANIETRNGQHPFLYHVINAQEIPFADRSLDVVIANHMLYHVPNRDKALAEIRRVLKSTGRFYAATNGHNHLQEIDQFVQPFITNNSDVFAIQRTNGDVFSLENGAQAIGRYFAQVEKREDKDYLVVTETEPLIAYILSSNHFQQVIVGEKLAALRQQIDDQIAKDGAVRIIRHSGLFVAHTM